VKEFEIESIRKNYKIGDRVTLKTKEELLAEGYVEDGFGGIYAEIINCYEVFPLEINELGKECEISDIEYDGFYSEQTNTFFSWNIIKQSKFTAGQRVERTDMDLQGTVLVAETNRCLVKPDGQGKCYWSVNYMKALVNDKKEEKLQYADQSFTLRQVDEAVKAMKDYMINEYEAYEVQEAIDKFWFKLGGR
jgi:hypothetical protein